MNSLTLSVSVSVPRGDADGRDDAPAPTPARDPRDGVGRTKRLDEEEEGGGPVPELESPSARLFMRSMMAGAR